MDSGSTAVSSYLMATIIGAWAAASLASCLAAALTTPAYAAPAAGHAAKARPSVVVAGQPVGIAVDGTRHTFWVAEFNTGKTTDTVAKITEIGHTVIGL